MKGEFAFQTTMKSKIEANLPKRKVLSNWWQSVPEWYGSSSKEEDLALAASRISNWRNNLKVIEEHQRENNLKKCFEGIQKMTNISKAAPFIKGLVKGEQILADPKDIDKESLAYFSNLYQAATPNLGEISQQLNLVSGLFDSDDIEAAINETGFNKALGPDLFDGNILKRDDGVKANFIEFAKTSLN